MCFMKVLRRKYSASSSSSSSNDVHDDQRERSAREKRERETTREKEANVKQNYADHVVTFKNVNTIETKRGSLRALKVSHELPSLIGQPPLLGLLPVLRDQNLRRLHQLFILRVFFLRVRVRFRRHRRHLYRRARFGLFLRLWRSRFLRDFRPRFFFLFVLCVVVLGVWNWHATICRQYYSRLLLLLLLIAHVLVLRARVLKKRVGSAQFLWFLLLSLQRGEILRFNYMHHRSRKPQYHPRGQGQKEGR